MMGLLAVRVLRYYHLLSGSALGKRLERNMTELDKLVFIAQPLLRELIVTSYHVNGLA